MGRRKEENSQAYSLKISLEAYQDIKATTGYIIYINHQPINAMHVLDSIHAMIKRISQNPYAFKECEEIPTVSRIYRRVNCLSWTIVYKIKEMI
jgi:plasmid stabilization system protein ParE